MDFERRYDSIEEVLAVAKSAEGKLVKEYDVTNRLETKKNKGGIGQIIEEGLFHMAPNSRAEADFANLDLELKVTGIKTNAKQTSFSAKERLVLNIIDYMEEYKRTFEESSLWHKNKKILLMFYKWIDGVNKGEFPILKSVIHQFSESDLAIVKQDWQIIIDKSKRVRLMKFLRGIPCILLLVQKVLMQRVCESNLFQISLQSREPIR